MTERQQVCGKASVQDGVTLVCGKPAGHVSPQCHDKARDRYFFPDH